MPRYRLINKQIKEGVNDIHRLLERIATELEQRLNVRTACVATTAV
jgi:hypothetical protein